MKPKDAGGLPGDGARFSFKRMFGAKPKEGPPRLDGVVTDQKLVAFYFKTKGIDAHPIATDRFLDKSRDEYNAAWLTRELVQNFVDHNPQYPGTLNGVGFTSEALPGGGKRFRIQGDWPFEDPTGVLSPHSDKPEDMNTAGGNGIGLKQAAIRFLRDFGVQRFEINGEGWSVNYRLAKALDINTAWDAVPAQAPTQRVRHDWLLAEIQEIPKTGKNVYIIETDNQQVIGALEQLPTLGVSSENPFLKDMDYQNAKGAIKWLPKDEHGRLFINGQVMNYKDKGETAEDYWRGPEGVTVVLNNLKYKISIDRPPVTPFNLDIYLNDVIFPMSKDDILEQLQRCEHLWAGTVDDRYSRDRQGSSVVIEKLTKALTYKGYNREEYKERFAGKNYLSRDKGVSDAQAAELQKQGYILCPDYLEVLGMPTAGSKLSSVEVASREVPQLLQHKREELAQEFGMEVAYEDFGNISHSEFITVVGQHLAGAVSAVETPNGNANILRLRLHKDLPKDLLFHALPKPKDPQQQLIYSIRGIAQD